MSDCPMTADELRSYAIRLKNGEGIYDTTFGCEIEELTDYLEQQASSWISVEERLPEVGDWCLIWATDNGSGRDCFVVHCDRHWGIPRSFTHWMPIPPLPKTESETE